MIARHTPAAGIAAAIVLALTLTTMPVARATTYSIIDLGDLAPRGVNSLGQVVGDYRLWSGGVLVDLRPFIDPVEPSGGSAWDINDAGQILSNATYNIAGPCSSTPGSYGALGIVQNGVLTCGSDKSPLPGRINSAGKAAFTEANVGGPIAHVWDPQSGITTTLPAGPEPPGPFSGSRSAYDINDLDQVVGKSPNHALLWQGNVVTDLGQLIGSAVAIGNGSQIAINNYSPSLGGNAYLWDAGVLTTIGQFGPTDINASAQAVGAQQVSGVSHAVLWESNLVTDLNDLLPPASGWVLNTAARISDDGRITGSGTLNGQAHGFLLVPDTISQQQANLAVTVTSSPPGPWSSGPVTADITVVNNGPDTATGATLIASYRSQQFFPNAPPAPSQGSCITTGGNDTYTQNPTVSLWCVLGSLPSGASATLQFISNSGIIATTAVGASAHAIELDTVSADNAASATIARATADLSVVASDSPDPVLAGQALTYTVVVTNNGPDTTINAVLSSSTPAGTTHVSAVSSQGSCSGTSPVSCTFGALSSGSSATVQIVSTPTAGPSVSRTFTTGLIPNGFLDPVPGNNSATVVTTVTPLPADLALTLTDSPDPITVGGTVTYTATVTNNGPGSATGVSVTGTLATCSLGTLASGASASCTRTAVASAAGTLSQTMSAAATESDPNPGDNAATASTTVQIPPADLALTLADTPDPVTVGGTVTYTATVTNNGPGTATGVTATGTLATCSLGTVASGASASCTRTAVASAAGTLSQTMSAAAAESDPNPGDNSATTSTTVNGGADLAVTITDSPDPVRKGMRLTYTVVVNNAGPLGATGTALSVILPANITFESKTSSQGTCTGTATVNCALGSLASGSTATVTIKIKPTKIGTATSTASVTGSSTDPNGTNNTATASTTVKK